ncbi:MAG: peptidylprolyl isomerase [Bacteroidetes bacterium]|nr:peptidylprolyl isomerase [Bacteroidota bacterium]
MKIGLISFCLLLCSMTLKAQPKDELVVDKVAAVVGNHIILLSDIETQFQQYLSQTTLGEEELRCRIIDQLLLNKLLLHQAAIDSVTVTDDQVKQKINQNMAYYISQIGSAEKLEKYYGKSIAQLKEEFRPMIKDQLVSQQMQSKVTSQVNANPSDVKAFFENIPKDSLPLINAEVEYSQILRNVPVGEDEKAKAKEQITTLRNRILAGEDFGTLALLYSQDKESAKQNGELGFVNRGDLVPEFEAAAFRLKNVVDVSPVVETQFGFHIVQLIERRGEKINVRHILIPVKVTNEDVVRTQIEMDTLVSKLRTGAMTFSAAAEKYSDDKDTKLNGGLVVNPATGSSHFEADMVDPVILFQLDKMKVGEYSNPISTTTREGGQGFRILFLKSRTEPHRLNLKDDYQKLQELALSDKQNTVLEQWRNKKKLTTYIRIGEDYNTCPIIKRLGPPINTFTKQL